MDFHSLTRRELQALCKKNKIAANMTNVAMADALKALQHVEGIDELTNPSEFETPQSPEKPVIGLPDIPRTVCRTSTRRRPIKEEPESSQPTTQTRRGTRRRIAGEAEEDKKDALATSAVPSSRKRGAVASARRKMEIQEATQMESSMQRVCSTRHSVRLAEKKMDELSLKERGRTEPIKIGDLSDNSNAVQENKGADSQTIAEEGLERGNVSDVVFSGKSNELQENSSDLKDEVKENNNCEEDDLKAKPVEGSGLFGDWDIVSIADEISNKLIDKERDVDDEARDETKEADLQTKQEVGCQRTDELDESDVQLGEKWEKAVDLNDEIIEKNGPNDFPVTIVLSDAKKLNEVLISENEQDMIADQDMDSDDSSKIDISGHDASNIMDLVTPPQSSLPQEINNSASVVESLNDLVGDSEKPELNSLNLSISADQHVVDGSDEDGGLPEGQMVCSEQLGIEKEPKIPEFLGCKKSEEDSNQLENATDAISSETTVDTELGSNKSVTEQLGSQVAVGFAVQESMNSCYADNSMPMSEVERCNSEAWVDDGVYTIEVEKLVMTTTHECPPSDSDTKDTDEIPFSTLPADPNSKDNNTLCFVEDPIPETWVDVHEIGEEQTVTATHECPPSLDKTPASSVKQMSSFRPPVSDAKDIGEIPFSNWAVDPVLGHIPRPPTQLTPSKSSSKKQTTIQRMTHVSDNNKENIDNSGRKVGSKTEKGKKIRKDIAEDDITSNSLHEASLRQLSKMLKEKLQIRNKMSDNDNKNVIKQQVVKTRPALQMLTENCIRAAGEPEKEDLNAST